jgi:hypothetical protein
MSDSCEDPLRLAFVLAESGINAMIALELLRLPASVFGDFDVDATTEYGHMEHPDMPPRTHLSVVVSRSPSGGVHAPQHMAASPHLCALLAELCQRANCDATLNLQFRRADVSRAPDPLRSTLLFSCVEMATRAGVSVNRRAHACAMARVLLAYARDDGSGVNVLWRPTEIEAIMTRFVGKTSLQLLCDFAPPDEYILTDAASVQQCEDLAVLDAQLDALQTALADAEERRAVHQRELLPVIMSALGAVSVVGVVPFPRVLTQLIATYLIVSP